MIPFKRHRVPPGAHPLVVRLFDTMNREQCSIKQLSERAGVAIQTIRQWKTRANPTVTALDACFGVFERQLADVPRREEL